MCGIAGIIAPNARNYAEEIQKMTSAIAHRGPDGEAHEFFKNAALGHRRLAIVDLSETGRQPMYSDTENECIVFNGEIYGYQELKKSCRDYAFRGNSDTEVILAMYRRHGTELLHTLPGMFAFALWDEEKQQLFCARDRFGEKPFFYAKGKNGELIFASEIKALLASGLVQPLVNPRAVAHYLQYGYVNTQHTIYSNIFSLPPAHSLVFSKGEIRVERYYSLPATDLQITLSEARDRFTDLLKKAVSSQLVADVEVGSFLSGGLDSSSIVALVSHFKPRQTTISFGYSGANSELKYADEIAQKYRTNHIEILENRGNIAQELQKTAPYFDEPFADMSAAPQYRICEAAARHLKVVLSGDAGDELFGGYHFYTVENRMRHHFSYKNILAKSALRIFGLLRETSFISRQNRQYGNLLDFHQNKVRNYFSAAQLKSLGYAHSFSQKYSFSPDPDSLNDLMRLDMEKYVPGNMLVKADRMAMANSLEVRTPFLDRDFAEFCLQLPANLKIEGNRDKIILREALESTWTESIRNRQKQGFGSPVKDWFEENNLLKLSDQLLGDPQAPVYKILEFAAARRFLNKDEKHWNLLQLALWAENNKAYL